MRGKGEGSVYKRAADDMWCAVIELPARGGERRRKTITSRDKGTVIRKLAEARSELARSGDLPTASQTVEQWMNFWLKNIAVNEVRPKTMANYRSFTTRHIIPEIGKVRMDKLSPNHIRKVTANMVDKNGKPLSETSKATAHRIMSSAFSAAKSEGRLVGTPAKDAKAPRIPVTHLEVLTVPEVAQFVQSYAHDPQRFLWMTFMLTGARRGEILGLTWDRVTDVLDLSWQLQRHPVEMVAPADYEYVRLDGGLYLTRPKSRSGWRVVPLVQPLAGVLGGWRAVAPTNPHNLVFAMPDGSPIDPDYASKQWPKVLAAAGIVKRVRIHDLRHTAVDMMYEAGVHETVIQEIVGHSSRSMTRAYRSRSSRPQLADAMTKMSALLGLEG